MKTIKITLAMMLVFAWAFLAAGCSLTGANGGTPSPVVNAGAYAAGQVLSASLKDPAKTEAAIAAREAVKYLDGQPSELGSVAINELLSKVLKDKLSPLTYGLISAGAGVLDSFLPPPETLGTSNGAILTRKILREFLNGLATGGGKGMRGKASTVPGHWLNK